MQKDDVENYFRIIEEIGEYGSHIPDRLKSFSTTSNREEGTLPKETKHLIALAIAINIHGSGCSAVHVNDAIKSGCDKHAVLETIGVAALMGGSRTIKNSKEAVEQLARITRHQPAW